MVFINPNKKINNNINNSNNGINAEQKSRNKVTSSYEEIKKQVEDNPEIILETKKSTNINNNVKK